MSDIVDLLESIGLKNEWKECLTSLYTDYNIYFDNTPNKTFNEIVDMFHPNRNEIDGFIDLTRWLAIRLLPRYMPDGAIGHFTGYKHTFELLIYEKKGVLYVDHDQYSN